MKEAASETSLQGFLWRPCQCSMMPYAIGGWQGARKAHRTPPITKWHLRQRCIMARLHVVWKVWKHGTG